VKNCSDPPFEKPLIDFLFGLEPSYIVPVETAALEFSKPD
jgi:hypothetical protein